MRIQRVLLRSPESRASRQDRGGRQARLRPHVAVAAVLLNLAHLAHGIFALEQVLAAQPDNVLACAEIARVYLMPGELRTSRQEFETVSKSEDLPPPALSLSWTPPPARSTMPSPPSPVAPV